MITCRRIWPSILSFSLFGIFPTTGAKEKTQTQKRTNHVNSIFSRNHHLCLRLCAQRVGRWRPGSYCRSTRTRALFALLGTTYGGNGVTNFALPNLQGGHADATSAVAFPLGQKRQARPVIRWSRPKCHPTRTSRWRAKRGGSKRSGQQPSWADGKLTPIIPSPT